MNASDIRQLTRAEILSKLEETYQALFNLRFQLATGKLKDTSHLIETKRDIARLKTVLREQELQGVKGQAAPLKEES
jgi:large subunit ribosomal protein L29